MKEGSDMSGAQISYIIGNEGLLDRIELLWQELNEHHKTRAPYFKDEYETLTYKQRKSSFMEKAGEGWLRVEIAEDMDQKILIGFCVSSLNERGQGEVESIFVKPAYRKLGIGDHLMKTALGWMDEQEASVKTVHVASGNEDAFSFYARYGFFPRQTILKQKN